jgi:hypothetical protein
MVTKEAIEKANELFYRDMVEAVTNKLLLQEINDVAYNVMNANRIVIKDKFLNGIIDLHQKKKIALWPKENKPLEASICSSITHAENFCNLFSVRSGPVRRFNPEEESIEEHNDNMLLDYCEFYKDYKDYKKREEALNEYMAETKKISDEFCLLLKSLNWLADIFRAEYDPMFFKIQGKFVGNKYDGTSADDDQYNYTDLEKEELIKQYM